MKEFFIDNLWKEPIFRERARWYQYVFGIEKYKSDMFNSFIFGVVILGFFIGFEKRQVEV